VTRTAIDLFCGSGGVTAGLKAAGWKILAAVDNDEVAARTYRANHPEVVLLEDDICDENIGARLEAATGRAAIDLMVVCAPCQPFSSQNRSGKADGRDQLIVRSVALVELIRPQIVFFENVPGLASPRHAKVLHELTDRMGGLGYHLSGPLVRDAADFGVPQRRRRCIMLASRSREAVELFKALDLSTPRSSVLEAIGDLAPLGPGEESRTDPLHRARRHSELAIRRLQAIPRDGGSRSSLPRALRLACHSDDSSFPDVYGRMSWSAVAPTLTTGCTDVTKGRFAHPEQDRSITPREAARLQTFPDEYTFLGNSTQLARQIGNAVPPLMITKLAQGFRAALDLSAKC
jgi:DNA (cytosine-5)-methyltransferase 1